MPIISNSIQNNGGSSQGIRSQTRTYRSGNSTLHLREGQTLRGVISDIQDRKSTRLNSSHKVQSRMPSSA